VKSLRSGSLTQTDGHVQDFEAAQVPDQLLSARTVITVQYSWVQDLGLGIIALSE